MLENIEAVIFDLDGTLVDSMWMWEEIDIEYLKKHNQQVPAGLQTEIAGMSFTETSHYFKKRFKIKDSVAVIQSEWIAMAHYNYANKATLKPGVRKFIQYLQTNNIKLGIASSNSKDLVEIALKAHGISDAFTAIHTSCEVESGKPSPDIYLLTASKLGVLPNNCLVFEDIPEGILAGKRAAMRTCAIWDEFSISLDSQKRELADYYIRDYEEVIEGTYEVL